MLFKTLRQLLPSAIESDKQVAEKNKMEHPLCGDRRFACILLSRSDA